MIEGDRKRFAELMLCLAEEYGAEMSKQQLELRFRALGKYSIQQVEKAALGLIQTSTRLPGVAAFCQVIEGDSANLAGYAWVRLARAYGEAVADEGAGRYGSDETFRVFFHSDQYVSPLSKLFEAEPMIQWAIQACGGFHEMVKAFRSGDSQWYEKRFRENFKACWMNAPAERGGPEITGGRIIQHLQIGEGER